VFEASQKDLAVADRWRGIALLAQLVFRDALEVWARFDDVHFAVVIYEEDQAAHQDWRCVMPPELFLPEHLAGGGLIAERHAGVVDAEQKIACDNQGGDIGGSSIVAPDDVSPRDVSVAVRPDRKQDLLGPTAADKNQSGVLAVNRRGNEFLRGPVHRPELLARLRIETGHATVAALNQLSAAGHLTDERRAVADSLMAAVDAPACFSIMAVQGDQKGIPFAVAIEDDLVFEQYRLVAEAPLAGMCARPDQPELFPAGQVVGGHDDIVTDAEGYENPLAVGGRRAGGMTVFFVDFLQRTLHDGLLPEDLSTGTVDAK